MVTQIGDRPAASCHETTFWHSGRGCCSAPLRLPGFSVAMLFMAHFAVNLNRNQRLIRMSYSQGPPGTTFPDHQEAAYIRNGSAARPTVRVPCGSLKPFKAFSVWKKSKVCVLQPSPGI